MWQSAGDSAKMHLALLVSKFFLQKTTVAFSLLFGN
jgi:hypothetical protein